MPQKLRTSRRLRRRLVLQAAEARASAGELLLPLVDRYVQQLRGAQDGGALMPTTNYSLPAGPALSLMTRFTPASCVCAPLSRGVQRCERVESCAAEAKHKGRALLA